MTLCTTRGFLLGTSPRKMLSFFIPALISIAATLDWIPHGSAVALAIYGFFSVLMFWVGRAIGDWENHHFFSKDTHPLGPSVAIAAVVYHKIRRGEWRFDWNWDDAYNAQNSSATKTNWTKLWLANISSAKWPVSRWIIYVFLYIRIYIYIYTYV